MKKLQIYVACHKADPSIRTESPYIPIQVGTSVHPEQDLGFLKDNEGDNISERNPYYSEMTAHYWMWKNVHDVQYIGLCHYRRYFGINITEDNIDKLMTDTAAIMINPDYHLENVYFCFLKFASGEDMTILTQVIQKLYPDYLDDFINFCEGVKYNPYNMLICRKDVYDKYMEWLFSILFECEKYIKPSPYANSRRLMGYFAELLMTLYFTHNHLKIKSIPYVKVEGEKMVVTGMMSRKDKLRMYIQEFLLKTLYSSKVKRERKYLFYNPAIIIGLKRDGINVIE